MSCCWPAHLKIPPLNMLKYLENNLLADEDVALVLLVSFATHAHAAPATETGWAFQFNSRLRSGRG